jgi:hypothetical protein
MIPIDSGPKLKHGENRRISKEKLTWADLSYMFDFRFFLIIWEALDQIVDLIQIWKEKIKLGQKITSLSFFYIEFVLIYYLYI